MRYPGRRYGNVRSLDLYRSSVSQLTSPSSLTDWPILVFTLIYHVVSIAFGLFLHLVGKCPGWMIESVSYNKSVPSPTFCTSHSSFVLLLVFRHFRSCSGTLCTKLSTCKAGTRSWRISVGVRWKRTRTSSSGDCCTSS